MTAYIIRRCLYAIPVLVGVNVIVFGLFFFVNTPDNVALQHLGDRRTTPEQVDRFKSKHNLDLPYFYNSGWRRIGSLSAQETSNRKTFQTAGAGRYALLVEAPQNEKAVAKAGTRRVKVSCTAPDRLALPAAFSADGQVELPANIKPRRFVFEIKPGDGPAPRLTLQFDLDDKGLKHRVALDYQQEDIGFLNHFTQTLFYQHSLRKVFFQYGKSMKDRPIGRELLRRMVPSLTITVPAFFAAILINLFFAMMLAFYRGTYVDYWGVFLCVILMSISGLFYIVCIQLVSGKMLRLFPISGYDYGFTSIKFVLMPVIIMIINTVGGGVRFYRTIFLEEINLDYVRTARAKGLPERTVLFVHVLKNAMIPILTNVVVSLPFLISAGIVLESFFAIPGLGSYTIDGIQSQDFFVVQAMVSLGAFMYVTALLLTDISYTLVDPRVRLE